MPIYFKTGASLIGIGFINMITTLPSTQGPVLFFSTLLSLLLCVAGLLQIWIDRESYYDQHKLKQIQRANLSV